MPVKNRQRSQVRLEPKEIVQAIKPIIRIVIKPVVQPVVQRLDRHEELLLGLKAALDVQFQRIAAMQAQLDTFIAASRRR